MTFILPRDVDVPLQEACRRPIESFRGIFRMAASIELLVQELLKQFLLDINVPDDTARFMPYPRVAFPACISRNLPSQVSHDALWDTIHP